MITIKLDINKSYTFPHRDQADLYAQTLFLSLREALPNRCLVVEYTWLEHWACHKELEENLFMMRSSSPLRLSAVVDREETGEEEHRKVMSVIESTPKEIAIKMGVDLSHTSFSTKNAMKGGEAYPYHN